MHGNELLKIIGVILLVITMGLVQINFSVLEFGGVAPNLVLITVFIVSFLEVRKSSHLGWRSFSAALLGGLFLDVFSTLPLGTEALMMFVLILIIERVLQFLDKMNFVVYLTLFLLLIVVYQIIFHLLSFGSFGFSWFTLVYNLSLAILFYGICFLVRILREK